MNKWPIAKLEIERIKSNIPLKWCIFDECWWWKLFSETLQLCWMPGLRWQFVFWFFACPLECSCCLAEIRNLEWRMARGRREIWKVQRTRHPWFIKTNSVTFWGKHFNVWNNIGPWHTASQYDSNSQCSGQPTDHKGSQSVARDMWTKGRRGQAWQVSRSTQHT